jgi:hypothetical protein
VCGGDGKIDWSKQPLFRPIWKDGKLSEVHHISGSVAAIPAHIAITPDYKMEIPHDDMAARLVKAPASCVLADFFAPGEGPHRHCLDKKGKALIVLAEQAKAEVDEHVKKFQVLKAIPDGGAGPVLHTRSKQKREMSLEKAREALGKKPKKARTVEFVG